MAYLGKVACRLDEPDAHRAPPATRTTEFYPAGEVQGRVLYGTYHQTAHSGGMYRRTDMQPSVGAAQR